MDAFDRLVEMGRLTPRRARELRAALEGSVRGWSPLLPRGITRLQAEFVSGAITRRECDRRIMRGGLVWGVLSTAVISGLATAQMLLEWWDGLGFSFLRIAARGGVSAAIVLIGLGVTFVTYLLGCLASIPWNRQRRCLEADRGEGTGP